MVLNRKHGCHLELCHDHAVPNERGAHCAHGQVFWSNQFTLIAPPGAVVSWVPTPAQALLLLFQSLTPTPTVTPRASAPGPHSLPCPFWYASLGAGVTCSTCPGTAYPLCPPPSPAHTIPMDYPHTGTQQNSYSNTGFAFLGRFLEGRAGMTWEEFLASEILKPLGMANTSVVPPPDLNNMGRCHFSLPGRQ
jgi:hypothetical protein